MILLLLGLAFGADEVVEVKAGDTVQVDGVWLSEGKFRSYVADSRKLPVCREALDKALDEVIEANQRVLDANKIASAQFGSDEKLIAEQVQTIADLGARLDKERQANDRLRQQRNTAWAIAGGFLAASTAAVVLTLN